MRYFVALLIIFLNLMQEIRSWRTYNVRSRLENLNSKLYRYMSQNENNLNRDLDVFFEKAAAGGSNFVRKLTVEERYERTIMGEELENKIFDIRDTIVSLSQAALSGDSNAIEKTKNLREELNQLKQQYISIVGGDDLPIYFGRAPETLQ